MAIFNIFKLVDSKQRSFFGFLIFLGVVSGFFDVLTIVSFVPFISALVSGAGSLQIKNQAFDSYLNYITNIFSGSKMESLEILGIATLLVFSVSVCFRGLGTFLILRFSFRQEAYISQKLFLQHLLIPYDRSLNINSADIAQKLLGEVQSVIANSLMPLLTTFSSLISVMFIISFLMLIDVKTTAIAVLVFGGFFVVVYLCSRVFLISVGEKRFVANRVKYRVVSEYLRLLKYVKLNKLERKVSDSFLTPALVYADNLAKARLIGQMPRFGLELVGVGGVILLGVLSIQNYDGAGYMQESLALFGLAGYRLIPALQAGYQGLSQIRYSQVSLKNLLESLDVQRQTLEKIKSNCRSYRLRNGLGVRFDNVTYRRAGTDIVREIDFDVSKISNISVIGASGSGKSTLLDLIAGLIEPSEGSIVIYDVLEPQQDIRKNLSVAFVPQDVYLIDDTIEKNICLFAEEVDFDWLSRCIDAVDLEGLLIDREQSVSHLPVGDNGANLSGGQKQRLAIARALYQKPDLLLLDEASSSLDRDTEVKVLDSINRLLPDTIIIHATHRESVSSRGQLSLKLANGFLAEVKPQLE